MTNCNIIKDLLPLYAEELCSPESRALVEEHLPDCKDCRETLDAFLTAPVVPPLDEQAALKRFSGTMKKRNLKKIVISTMVTVLTIALLAVLVWVPEFPVTYSEGLISPRVPVDGGLDLHIDLPNFKNAYAVQHRNEDGTEDIYMTVVRNVATMVIPNRDESVDFVRVGNNLCVCYKNVKDNLLFQLEDDSLVRNIYYVAATDQQLYAAAISQDFQALDPHLVYEAGN